MPEHARKTSALACALALCAMLTTPLAAQGSPQGSTANHDHPVIEIRGEIGIVKAEGGRTVADIDAYCLDCHGDKRNPESNETGGPPEIHSHPVGSTYPGAGPELVEADALDDRITLVRGTVSCISCHDHDAPDHRLVIEENGGGLCMACHRK